MHSYIYSTFSTGTAIARARSLPILCVQQLPIPHTCTLFLDNVRRFLWGVNRASKEVSHRCSSAHIRSFCSVLCFLSNALSWGWEVIWLEALSGTGLGLIGFSSGGAELGAELLEGNVVPHPPTYEGPVYARTHAVRRFSPTLSI